MRTFTAFLLLLPSPAVRALEFARHVPVERREAVERDLDEFCRLDHGREEFGRGRGPGKRALEGMARGLFGLDVSDCRDLRAFLEGRIDLVVSRFGKNDIIVKGPDRPFLKIAIQMARIHVNIGRLEPNPLAATHLGRVPGILLPGPREPGGTDLVFGYVDDAGRPALPGSALADPVPGVVMVTDHFFLSPSHPDPSDTDSPANSVFRVALLAHESLHGDPRFDHVPCPDDAQDGERRCDAVADGANGIQALLLLYGQGACGACTQEERRMLGAHARAKIERLEPAARERFLRSLGSLF